MKFITWTLAVSALVLGLSSCSSCNRVKPGAVAEVGDFTITGKDATFRDEVIRIYYPQETRSLGLDQLVKAYTAAQVLINNGHRINDDVITKEAERIKKSSLMPEVLEKIRRIFGDDEEAYKRVYVLPTYAERVIYYEFFLNDKGVQAGALKDAEKFLEQARANPGDFQKLVKHRSLSVGKLDISLTEGLKWRSPEEEERDKEKGGKGGEIVDQSGQGVPFDVRQKMKEQQTQQVSEEGKRWIDEVIKPLKPGEVYNKVIDRQESWLVVRYLQPKAGVENTYELEAVSLPKEDYAKWMTVESGKVKIIYADPPESTGTPAPAGQ